ncbi:Monogalactosyldiacylglycerol synthase [Oceanithermus profundus DSM 14977]|uniref:Monogalactosyldiacylglycerol synthase n=1 Tax=Oceanithermus profundus (strain DSM 14977 / NBRC 100410 / VKM B-2274 / 506) TaxID=670487 RepID=E4UA98_OCEP5|nr:UDP-N-acetylglucosamine 2-epimerase [Oceanithermus profundus]ADR37541.1 Monogalactosyldiacylglycerol synthase [Oceanithermus profundus DSM 14977]
MKAVLLSASFGGGHRQAARALRAALEAEGGCDCVEADYLRFIPAWEREPVTLTYAFWLRYWPAAYRWFYHWSNRPSEPKLIAETFSKAGLAGVIRFLGRTRPDAVVASYATVAAVAHRARRTSGQAFLNSLVVTDFRAHRHWARPEADLIFAAFPETAEDLVRHGVDPERVQVTGIPILPAFAALPDRSELRRRLGFDERPVVLLTSGGAGAYRSYERVLRVLLSLDLPMQLVTFNPHHNGTHEEERGRMRWIRTGLRDDFPEWMGAADWIVGKAGGLTASEALALGVPMVVFDPIPGQEEGNAQFLEERGAAVWIRQGRELRSRLARLIPDEARRAEMAAAARALGRPEAAQAIARALLQAEAR